MSATRALFDQSVPTYGAAPRSVLSMAERESKRNRVICSLRAHGMTSAQIAVSMGLTEAFVRRVMVELGLHKPRRWHSASHALESLPRADAELLAEYRSDTGR